MSKSKQQFNHARQYARDIKRLYPINTALKILEKEHKYYLTNETNFNRQIKIEEFIILTK
tara:strand:+ start:303 stop:482 length:180 start_codon:yes stop_codon:yes gene_type:complete